MQLPLGAVVGGAAGFAVLAAAGGFMAYRCCSAKPVPPQAPAGATYATLVSPAPPGASRPPPFVPPPPPPSAPPAQEKFLAF